MAPFAPKCKEGLLNALKMSRGRGILRRLQLGGVPGGRRHSARMLRLKAGLLLPEGAGVNA
jgi:hypothetical protein